MKNICFSPGENVNVIYGENAQGKTNLIEAIWLFTGTRSFRKANDKELIAFGNKKCNLALDFYAAEREQTSEIVIEQHRKVTLNGVKYHSPLQTLGNFCAVVFSPVHLSLIQDGPQVRRDFIDNALCHIKSRYAAVLSDYKRAILQRNNALKEARKESNYILLLDVLDEEISKLGAYILAHRYNYIEALLPICQEIYSGISSSREIFSCNYRNSVDKIGKKNRTMDEWKELLLQALHNSRKDDLYAGITLCGPHRDDISVLINDISARTYGSQGQQRSCALTLKLGEAALMERYWKEPPVILLDDVMSELDSQRQNYILNHIQNSQVFITCCEPTPALKKEGKFFSVKNGLLQIK